jgi:hypothetical protein
MLSVISTYIGATSKLALRACIVQRFGLKVALSS